MSHAVTCPIVFILFYKQRWQAGVFKVMKNDHFSAFSHFGSFPQVFRQVNECFISKLHKMIRLLHEVACPIVFILFYDRYWERGVLKFMKNDHFFSIFSGFSLFPQVFGQVNKWPILGWHEMIIVLHLIFCPVVFILFEDRYWQGGVRTYKKWSFFQYFQPFRSFSSRFWAG